MLGRLEGRGPQGLWLAEEPATRRSVIAAEVSKSRARRLIPAAGVTHEHLAEIIEIVSTEEGQGLPFSDNQPPPEALAIVERVPGRSLFRALQDGHMSMRFAVHCAANTVSAIAELHRNRAPHGAISDKSVIVETTNGRTNPVLTQLIEAPRAVFASPERLHGAGPSRFDDVWAAHALLYTVLTGHLPFQGNDAKSILLAIRDGTPAPLESVGIEDEKLQELVDRGLRSAPDERTDSIYELEETLHDWLCVDEAFESAGIRMSRTSERCR
ncbi:MAG: hypothetical protein FWD57_02960 [Polyangiaceae bacterium]|nr:hypothetical protein [Polyangiaceae bacterium]